MTPAFYLSRNNGLYFFNGKRLYCNFNKSSHWSESICTYEDLKSGWFTKLDVGGEPEVGFYLWTSSVYENSEPEMYFFDGIELFFLNGTNYESKWVESYYSKEDLKNSFFIKLDGGV